MQQPKKTRTRESGVSEVIGAVLLISIGVTAAAVIGVAVLSQPTPVKIPALDAIISSTGHTIQILHNGGDTLQSAAIQILVDGTAEPFEKGGDPSWQSWSIGETLTYVDPNPTGAKSVQIVFTGASSPAILASAFFGANGMPLASRTITATAGSGGTISPLGAVGVIYGDSQQFNITPSFGYYIVDVDVDGSSVGVVSNYTFPSVTSDHSISATFALSQFTITPTAGLNGTISPGTPQTVTYFNPLTFTISPNTGYYIANVLIDGSSVGNVSSFTFMNVTSAQTISATFAINTYTINATAGSNGAISPSGLVPVNYGANQSFTITNNTGYYISSVLVDGSSVAAVSPYNFTNVQANHNISATFAGLQYTINATAGFNGAISPSGLVPVSYGAGQSFTITPNTGYYTASILVNGAPVVGPPETGNPVYSFSNVIVNQNISATFNATPTITALSPAAGPVGGGTVVIITGSGFTGVTAVKFGSTPATSYTFINDTSITATAPSGSLGTAAITVSINTVNSATVPADIYTYTTPLTAISAITGTPTVGSTLTAGTLSPAGATATYQWKYSTTPSGTYNAISGAISNTYIVAAAYLGDYLEVFATGTGSYTGTVNSTATSQITTPLTSIGTITGTPTVGSTLTAGTLSPAGATANYQWEYSTTPAGTYTTISGATSNTYVVAGTYVNDYLEVVATGTSPYTGSVTSAASGQIAAEPLTGITAITGTAQVGSTLGVGTLSPVGATATYQWEWCATSGGTYANIAGATGTTYVVAGTYVNDYLEVVATGTSPYTGSVTSAASGPIAAESLTGITAITGTAQVGSTLGVGTLSPAGATATYQWEWCATSGGTYANIAGATGTTYIVAATYVNDYIKVVATGTSPYTGTATSAASGPIAAEPLSGITAITGTVQVGQQLTAGTLSPSGATATYQWQRSTTATGTYTAISGATLTTYTPVAGDGGYYIEVVATGSNGYTNSVTSADVGPVTIVPSTQTFTSSGTLTIPQGAINVQYCVVGGGGGGGYYGGGGGAGGFLTGTVTVASLSSYTVTVGGGGNGATSAAVGSSGTASVLGTTISAAGGGGGGSSSATATIRTGANGGSGGGGVRTGTNYGTGNTPATTPSQGNNGGSGNTNGANYLGGGGGGTGGAGTTATTTVGGPGGAGSTCTINSGTYAGGGGGGVYSTYTAGTATYGGGAGGKGAVGNPGTTNTGGGGGGGGYTSPAGGTSYAGGTGGSGIVVVKYT